MSEMVERVAEAINTAFFGPGAPRMMYVAEAARAAIEAMREPTEAMVRAAKIWPGAPDDFEQDVVMGNLDGLGIYRAMIDAALKETPALR